MSHSDKMVPRLPSVAAAVFAAASLLAQPTIAQPSNEDLARQAADPTQSPLSLQFYNYYTPKFQGMDGSGNQLVFRPVIPYKAFGVDNIVRFTLTQNTSSPFGRSGFGDIQMLQLSIVERWGGRFAYGLSGSLPTGTEPFTNDKWTLGPAAAYVTSTAGGITYGALAQTFFSIAGNDEARDISQIALQPVMAVPLGGTKTLSLGNSGVLYDIERSRWASLAPSLQFSWLTDLWGFKWRPSFELTHEFRDLPGNPQTTYRLGAQILLPR